MLEMHVKAKGNVQAVGFRATCVSYAQKLHLKGFVRNLSDGSVEIVAQGEKKNLEALIAKLKDIFDAEISSEYREPSKELGDFSISL